MDTIVAPASTLRCADICYAKPADVTSRFAGGVRGNQQLASNGLHSNRKSYGVEVVVDVVKGSAGFGFTLADTERGQVIKSVNDVTRCRDISPGDVILAVNGVHVVDWTHDMVVDVLQHCRTGCVTRLTLLTSRLTSSSNGCAPPVPGGHVIATRRNGSSSDHNQDMVGNGCTENGQRRPEMESPAVIRRTADRTADIVRLNRSVNHVPDSRSSSRQSVTLSGDNSNRNSDTSRQSTSTTIDEQNFQFSSLLRRPQPAASSQSSRTGTPCPSTPPESSPSSQRRRQQPHERPPSRGVRGTLAALVRRSAVGTPTSGRRSLPDAGAAADQQGLYPSGPMSRSPSVTSLNFSGTPDFIPASAFGRGPLNGLLISGCRSPSVVANRPDSSVNHVDNDSAIDSSTNGSTTPTSQCPPTTTTSTSGVLDDSFQSHDRRTSVSSTASSSTQRLNQRLQPNEPSARRDVTDDMTSRRRSELVSGRLKLSALGGSEECNGYNVRTEMIFSAPYGRDEERVVCQDIRSASALAEPNGIRDVRTVLGSSMDIPARCPDSSARRPDAIRSPTTPRAAENGTLDRRHLRNTGPSAVRDTGSGIKPDRNRIVCRPEVDCDKDVVDSPTITSSSNGAVIHQLGTEQVTFYEVELHRGSRGFGFSIRGGKEFPTMPLSVLNIADGGSAYMDGRLQNGDLIAVINGVSTVNMTHTEAVELIQNSSSPLHLVVKRQQQQEAVRARTVDCRSPEVTMKFTNRTPPVSLRTPKTPSPRLAHRIHR